MKKALIAVDSSASTGSNYKRFFAAIKFFQDKKILSRESSVASIYHASMSPLPLKFYNENKTRLLNEANVAVKHAVNDRIQFSSVKVLHSDSPTSEDHVEHLANYAGQIGADLLTIGSSDRSGLPYWFLGSFSETAAFQARMPVLIIKPHLSSLALSKVLKFVLAVDVDAMPSSKVVRWIAKLAHESKASIELVYVHPKSLPFLGSLLEKKDKGKAKLKLESLKSQFSDQGLKCRFKILEESKSIAHTVSKFADELKVWMIITTTTERSKTRKLLLGSKARRILALTKRPFCNIRLD